MKKLITLFSLGLIVSTKSFGFSRLAHPMVGHIAQNYLDNNAKQKIKEILGNQDLATVSTYADEIKKDQKYASFSPWHYVSIPTGMTYAQSPKTMGGDIFGATLKFLKDLKDPSKSNEDKKFALKFLVHLIGDFHQPLHVGLAEDRGGNNVGFLWKGHNSNLHFIWDEDILEINEQRTSMEYSQEIYSRFNSQASQFKDVVLDNWVKEAMTLRPIVYAYKEWMLSTDAKNPSQKSVVNMKDGWEKEYANKVKPALELQIFKAGVRLAELLNQNLK